MPYCVNPAADGQWMVWDIRAGTWGDLPRRILYLGSMEECGRIADSLNARTVVRFKEP